MAGIPNQTLAEFYRGNIDLVNDTLRVALYDNSTAYTFDQDNHDFVSDILDGGTTAQEYSGSSGYTGSSDRQTIANATVSVDDTDDEGVFDADDVTWSGVAGSDDIQGWIVYKQVGGDDTTPGDDPIILVVDDDMSDAPSDLPIDLGNVSVDITINWNAEGITNITVN